MKTVSLSTLALLFLLATPIVRSESLSLFSDSFSFVSGASLSDGQVYSARLGVWDGGFNQRVAGTVHTGFMEVNLSPDFFELSVVLSQIDNTNFSVGEQFSLAIFTDGSGDAQTLDWSNGSFVDFIIVTDPSWLIPTFSNNPATLTYDFSSNTTAVVGNFDWNAGSPILTAVPEPSTYAAIVGLIALALVGYRRRFRK